MKKPISWTAVKVRLEAAHAATNRALALNPERMAAVMNERAERLARRSVESQTVENILHVLTFSLGAEIYALEIQHIAEVLPLERITPVPSAPPAFVGVFNLRGEIIPVFDLALLLQFANSDGDKSPEYLLVLRGAGFEVALKVGQVSQIKHLAPGDLFPKTESAAHSAGRFKALGHDSTQILDFEQLLSNPIFRDT